MFLIMYVLYMPVRQGVPCLLYTSCFLLRVAVLSCSLVSLSLLTSFFQLSVLSRLIQYYVAIYFHLLASILTQIILISFSAARQPAIESKAFFSSLHPVSYTHLDVYKRQIVHD